METLYTLVLILAGVLIYANLKSDHDYQASQGSHESHEPHETHGTHVSGGNSKRKFKDLIRHRLDQSNQVAEDLRTKIKYRMKHANNSHPGEEIQTPLHQGVGTTINQTQGGGLRAPELENFEDYAPKHLRFPTQTSLPQPQLHQGFTPDCRTRHDVLGHLDGQSCPKSLANGRDLGDCLLDHWDRHQSHHDPLKVSFSNPTVVTGGDLMYTLVD